jgi:segregation and condensation protein A
MNNFGFNLSLEEFEGPLDVLTNLIHDKKMNILDIDVVQLADQYVDFVEKNFNKIQINDAIGFLNMVTFLIELKSKKMLLSSDENIVSSDFELARDELVARIIEHEKYKKVANKLNTFIDKRQQHHSTKPNIDHPYHKETEILNEVLPTNVSVSLLEKTFKKIIDKYKSNFLNDKKISLKEIDIYTVQNELLDYLSNNKKTSIMTFIFQISIDKISLQYISVLFNVVLELTKHSQIKIIQDDNDIIIEYLN